jgi:hypothetical protein
MHTRLYSYIYIYEYIILTYICIYMLFCRSNRIGIEDVSTNHTIITKDCRVRTLAKLKKTYEYL